MTLLQESLVRISALIVCCGIIGVALALIWDLFCKALDEHETEGNKMFEVDKIRKRRRYGKSVVLVLLSAIMIAVTSWTAPRDITTDDVHVLSASELQYHINVSKLSPGHAAAYAETYPEYADQFLGIWEE